MRSKRKNHRQRVGTASTVPSPVPSPLLSFLLSRFSLLLSLLFLHPFPRSAAFPHPYMSAKNRCATACGFVDTISGLGSDLSADVRLCLSLYVCVVVCLCPSISLPLSFPSFSPSRLIDIFLVPLLTHASLSISHAPSSLPSSHSLTFCQFLSIHPPVSFSLLLSESLSLSLSITLSVSVSFSVSLSRLALKAFRFQTPSPGCSFLLILSPFVCFHVHVFVCPSTES